MKKTNEVNQELKSLKLAVIQHHSGESNAYLREQLARDACWSSNNGIQYKTGQMMEVKAEMASLRPTKQSEVVGTKLDAKLAIYKAMQLELNELTERFNADMAVHKQITGEDWTPRTKKSTKDVSQILNEVDSILGKDENPIIEAN